MSHDQEHQSEQHAASAPDAPKPRKHPILIIVMVRPRSVTALPAR